MLLGGVGRGPGSRRPRWSRLSAAPLHPFPDAGPPGREEVVWELSEEVFPLSLFYFGVKVGDGFDQFLILGHPNPLSPARA